MGYYEDLPFINHEYEDGQWDAASGVAPGVMEAELTRILTEDASRPYPVSFALGYAYVLDNGMLGINVHTPFPDKICNGVVYRPHARAGVFEKLSTLHYREVLDKAVPSVRSMRLLARSTGVAIPDLDVWHTVYDWKEIISLGFSGILDRVRDECERKNAAGELTEKQKVFYESAEIASAAVLRYISRLSRAMRDKGMTREAEAYDSLALRAPQTFYEALCAQHIALTVGELARERIRSLGFADRLWTPFYVSDIESGRITEEEARELLRYFLIKISAENRYANQPLCIRADWSEDSAECGLMLMLLDVYGEIKTDNPKLHVRCCAQTPPVILRKLMSLTRAGSSSIILFNDEIVIKAYEKTGCPAALAREYLPIGCNETCIPGHEEMHICSAWINLAKGVEYAINGGEDNLQKIYLFGRSAQPETWEEFLQIYYEYLHRFAEFTLDNINKQAVFSYEANPAPFLSATMRSCVERGRDVFDCGLPMADESVKIFALGTAVDSLLAVKKYVYEKRELTLGELADILKNNWKGAEALRTAIKNEPVKWGNGEPEADGLARDIYAFMGREIIGKPTANGGVFRMGGDSVNMAESYGYFTGASADGRLARAPLSKNIRPVNGCEHRGISGLFKSFAAIDFTDAADGAPLDFMLHPTAAEGEEGLDFLCSMIRIFFANGGFCIQGNIVDLNTLLAAKKEPEKYPDLQVRVCGWNEYFVNMAPALQADFISRASGGQNE